MSEIRDFDLSAVQAELRAEFDGASDRGVVLVASSALEAALGAALADCLRPPASAVLDGPHAPAGNFSARIALAAALGLVSDDEKRDLTTVRRIRNVVAHEVHGSTFEADSLHDLALNLQLIDRLYAPNLIPFAVEPSTGEQIMPLNAETWPEGDVPIVDMTPPTSPRERFFETSLVLLGAIMARQGERMSFREKPPSAPQEFENPWDIAESLVASHKRLEDRRIELTQEAEGLGSETDHTVTPDERIRMIALVSAWSKRVMRKSIAATEPD